MLNNQVQGLASGGGDILAGITLAPDRLSETQAGMATGGLLYLLRFPAAVGIGLFVLGQAGSPAGDRIFATGSFLGAIWMAASSDDDTEFPPILVPGIADFAGSPDPNDPCKGFGLGSTISGGKGPWKWVKGSEFGVHPEIPSTVKNVAEFNKQIVKWGGSIDDALVRMRTLTSSEIAEMGQKGLTSSMAQDWSHFYADETYRRPSNTSSCGRTYLMQHIADELAKVGY